MSDKKAEEKVSGVEVAGEVTPGWQKLLYNPDRKAKVEAGEMTLRDYHGISGPEMLQMALIGFRMYEQGKYSEAKTIFSGLIQLEPTEAYYYTALGAVFLAEEELEQAGTYFNIAIKLNPKEVAPYVNRGEVNLRSGKILEAAQDFAKAVELDPKYEDPLTQRARVLAAAALEMIENVEKGEAGKDAKKK
ncbi:MAG: tetratricopeptide repeat protein [Myxococcaceae bacterium]